MKFADQQNLFNEYANLKQAPGTTTRALEVIESVIGRIIQTSVERGARDTARGWGRHPAFEPSIVIDDVISHQFNRTFKFLAKLAADGAALTAPIDQIAYNFARDHAAKRFGARCKRYEELKADGVEIVDITDLQWKNLTDTASGVEDSHQNQEIIAPLLSIVAKRPDAEQRAFQRLVANIEAGPDSGALSQGDRQALSRLRAHLRNTGLAYLVVDHRRNVGATR